MKINGDLNKFYHYAFPTQAVLVTCNDEKGKTNVITIAWHTTISRKPPLYGISVAPKRYSHELIERTKEFVVNFVPYSLADKVNFCGTYSGRKKNKIGETKLTLIPAQKVKAPLIKECYAHLECKLAKTLPIGDHTLFVGEVVNILLDENAFVDDLLDNEKIQPTYYVGDNIYTTLDKKEKKWL
ncbi:MAG: flavin reductase family protein [Candidatus Thermoplasmatota archaeon]|jgi:flavin reductase (DIM6/NTAB) family NADH-FMN oxidoreductase RutF|nr:flavin reductase family protein [Candidatus Thermoplasmatota archaeon]